MNDSGIESVDGKLAVFDYFTYLNRCMDKVASMTFFKVLKRSQLQVFPLIVVGAVLLCALNFPFGNILGEIPESYKGLLADVVNGTYGVAALAMLCSMSYNYGVMHNKKGSGEYISPNLFVVISLSCFFILHGEVNFLTFSEIASLGNGIAQAFFVSSVASFLLHIFIRIGMRIPVSDAGYDLYSREILSLIPACVGVIVFFALLKKLVMVLGFGNLYGFKDYVVCRILSLNDSEFLNGLFYTLSSQCLWFFGVHGPNSLSFFNNTVLSSNMDANIALIQAGGIPTHVLTKEFIDCFAMAGGSGLTLSLLIAIFMKGRDSGVRKISFLALLVCVFNVNEPLLFGIPLILNPVYALPFIFIPILAYCIAYGATLTGFVPVITHVVHWTTPPFLNAYLATGAWSGVLLQAFIVMVGAAAYMPFVIIFDMVVRKQYEQGMNEVLAVVRSGSEFSGYKCMGLSGFEGFIARSLAHDLRDAIRNEEQLYMVYQPQVDVDAGRILGAEALLRWHHPSYGHISPEVIVALAEDMNCVDQLTYFILRESCAQLGVWHGRFGDEFFVSVNFTPSLFTDEKLESKVASIIRDASVPAHCLEIEITESVAMTSSDLVLATLHNLRRQGIRISIDDFGMGHTSLRYLRELPIDKVKIDRSLTFGSLNDVNRHIVTSILDLCRNINMKVVVEGVEDNIQLERLRLMGGSCFQGYYFSRPVPGEECMQFIEKWKKRDRVQGNSFQAKEVLCV
ncbi:EAL domain-containing protein [Maridesulfovibrio sp.]|uniref:EAL domain-containing protein n=1 Tax=Maridesulfovibrio sp. TaxID=2795000 RepID=UPI0039EED684